MQMNNEQIAMRNGGKVMRNSLYSLVSLDEFKSVLGFDDRDDRLCRFCLVTSTLTVEQYCMRKFISKKYSEFHEFNGDGVIFLREYPVRKITAVYSQMRNEELQIRNEKLEVRNENIVDSKFYRVVPGLGSDEDITAVIKFDSALTYRRLFEGFRVLYQAGYDLGRVPADLEAACLELAAWNMGRYRGRRIGMAGGVRKDGERWETAMPSNVRGLLETYRRRVI